MSVEKSVNLSNVYEAPAKVLGTEYLCSYVKSTESINQKGGVDLNLYFIAVDGEELKVRVNNYLVEMVGRFGTFKNTTKVIGALRQQLGKPFAQLNELVELTKESPVRILYYVENGYPTAKIVAEANETEVEISLL